MKFSDEQKFVIGLVKRVLLKPILKLIEEDPHQWSTRPCTTCQTISQMIEEPFGCIKKAKEHSKETLETKLPKWKPKTIELGPRTK